MKKKIAALLAAVFALSLLAACGGNEHGTATLGEYKGIAVEVEREEVTDEDITTYINYLTAYYPAFVESDKEVVEDGDTVKIDYVGKKDDIAFAGGTANGALLVIGSNSYIDGFEDGLIGVKKGETVDLNLTFPDPYQNNPDLAGAEVVFTVTVQAIGEQKALKVEELTDEYVASNFNAATVEEFMDLVTSSLKETNEYYAQNDARAAIITKLAEICTVENLSEKEVENRVSQYMEDLSAYCTANGIAVADYLETYEGKTEEEYKEFLYDDIKAGLESEIILQAVADKEKIEADETGYATYLTNMATNYGYASTDELVAEYGEEYLKNSYRCNLALDFVVENAVITYVEPVVEEATE